jgi:hypothetical protein
MATHPSIFWRQRDDFSSCAVGSLKKSDALSKITAEIAKIFVQYERDVEIYVHSGSFLSPDH